MDEHKKFLADRLLSEEQPITYRLLSRSLDVHVNTAKEMLYDFHQYQNAQKANSVHATYLVHGVKARQDGVDVEMTSSASENEALSETVPTTVLTLVREENLSAVLSEYQAVDSIHVYSLAPSPQRDLSLLSELTRSLYEYSVKEDAARAVEKYGVIGNSNVRRRNRSSKAPASVAASKPVSKPTPPVVKAEPAVKPAPALTPAVKAKQETTADKPLKKESVATPSSSAGKSAPAAKRGAAGGIMQSFAKAAAKPPKPKKEPVKEEPAMSDDGEADDDDSIPTVKTSPRALEARRLAQQKRTEYLKRMMEESDDNEDEKEIDKDEDEEMEEAPEPEEEPELVPEPEPEIKKAEDEPSEVVTSTAGGKRRGKRRIMQKKRIVDDDGYMVTVQEPGWESFSEDEVPPPAKKPTPASTPSSSAGKTKKPSGKSGQGNIMSFFSKK